MSEPREYTEDEIRNMFLDQIWVYVRYWSSVETPTVERLEGLAHSILCILDGVTADLPGFIVAPHPHEDDMEYNKEQGKNWYPDNNEADIFGDIGGCLHELFFDRQ